MESSFFTLTDYAYIIILLLSCVSGFTRGFTKELLSLCAWFGSAFLAGIISPYSYSFFESYIKNKQLVHCISFFVWYIIIVVVALLVSSSISAKIKSTALSGLDCALGMLFGILRVAVLLFSIYGAMMIFNISQDSFKLLRDSKIAAICTSVIRDIMPTLKEMGIIEYLTSAKNNISEKNEEILQAESKEMMQNAMSADDIDKNQEANLHSSAPVPSKQDSGKSLVDKKKKLKQKNIQREKRGEQSAKSQPHAKSTKSVKSEKNNAKRIDGKTHIKDLIKTKGVLPIKTPKAQIKSAEWM